MTTLREEDVQAVLDALRSGWLTMGPRIAAFEEAFAAYAGAPHAVACSSGAAALHLALLAERLEPGDEVLVPALAGGAAADAVRHAGGEPVFCDVVAPALPVLDARDAERRAGPRAKAIVVVHAYGHAAGIPAPNGVHVIEDCRAAVGAGVGTAGRSGCFSFADGRELAIGEGGMVTTADEDVAARVRLLRQHAMTSGTWDRHRGHSDTYDVVDVGFNFRLDEPRAALGTSRLAHLTEDLEALRATAQQWRAALDGVAEPCPSDGASLAVLVADRDAALSRLAAAGVAARPEPALADLPQAQAAAQRLVVLALDPCVDGETVARALAG